MVKLKPLGYDNSQRIFEKMEKGQKLTASEKITIRAFRTGPLKPLRADHAIKKMRGDGNTRPGNYNNKTNNKSSKLNYNA